MMDPLNESAQIALRDCLGVKSAEMLLIVTDDSTVKIGQTLFEVGKELSLEAVLLVMPERDVNGAEPPEAISEMMQRFDVVVCPTAKSLTHTNARRDACSAGARVGTMPGITEEVMIRTLKADYHKIAERTYQLSDILNKGRNVHISTALGTDVEIPIAGINAISSTGLVLESGMYGNLPSGESFLMPVEEKTNGVVIVDGSFAGVGKIETEPIRLTIVNGYAEKIEGGLEAKILEDMLKPLGKKAFNVAELGIGTNDQAIVTGKILEDEKVMGTVHIALGNNISMGGTCDIGIHVDGVILSPTVSIDGELLMNNGKFLRDELL
jgi:leucyl aminopeptidase (aminopeptidase T)